MLENLYIYPMWTGSKIHPPEGTMEKIRRHIIFYGSVPTDIMEICSAGNVTALQFPSEFALSRKGAVV